MGANHSGKVTIKIEIPAKQSDDRLAIIRAIYPDDPVNRAFTEKKTIIKLAALGDES